MSERARHPHQYLPQDYSNPMLRNCVVIVWKRAFSYQSQAVLQPHRTQGRTRVKKLITADYMTNRLCCFHLLRLLLGGGSAKIVKVNLEPFVDAGVNGMILVADLLRGQTLLSGLVLRSCAVLICATHKQHVPISQAAVP